jgi:mannose-6-phosphate isomerase-like protein (cupin superfamily)
VRVFRKGEELYDKRFGERYTLLQTAEETGGELARVEDVVRPGPSRRPASGHPNQEERFEVISGTLGLKVDGEEHLLGPRESFVVSPGVKHLPRNAGEGDLRFVAEMRPPGRFEEFLAEITAANNSGREGLAYLLTAAQVFHRFPDVERPTPLPRPLERALFALLAGVGELFGASPEDPKSPEVAEAATGTADGSRGVKGFGIRKEDGNQG